MHLPLAAASGVLMSCSEIVFLCLGVSWTKGNAENLPFDEGSFDVYTVAFGVRNMTHVDKVN